MPAADGGWCGSGRRQQPTTAAVACAAMAVVAGGGSSWKLRGLGREEDEVNLKKPSSPSFYKLLGSRTVTWFVLL